MRSMPVEWQHHQTQNEWTYSNNAKNDELSFKQRQQHHWGNQVSPGQTTTKLSIPLESTENNDNESVSSKQWQQHYGYTEKTLNLVHPRNTVSRNFNRRQATASVTEPRTIIISPKQRQTTEHQDWMNQISPKRQQQSQSSTYRISPTQRQQHRQQHQWPSQNESNFSRKTAISLPNTWRIKSHASNTIIRSPASVIRFTHMKRNGKE